MPKKLGIFHVLYLPPCKANFLTLLLLFYLKCAIINYYHVFIIFDCPDVYIDVPDIIDISHMRSRGIQPGEELLPEAGMSYCLLLPNSYLNPVHIKHHMCICFSIT